MKITGVKGLIVYSIGICIYGFLLWVMGFITGRNVEECKQIELNRLRQHQQMEELNRRFGFYNKEEKEND